MIVADFEPFLICVNMSSNSNCQVLNKCPLTLVADIKKGALLNHHDIFVSVLGSISFPIYLAKILMLNSMIIRFTQSTEGGAILIPDASSQGLFLRPLDTERARVKDGFQFC